MRTYSLTALVLATIGTGLLSAFVLISGVSTMPNLPGVDSAVFQSKMQWANESIEGTFWFWAVISLASASIALTVGAMLTKVRVHHQLPGKVVLTVVVLIAFQSLLEMAGFHSLNTAFAQVHTPIQSGVSVVGWAASERMRILLAGAAVVSLIYAVALCVQIAHDNRGTRSP